VFEELIKLDNCVISTGGGIVLKEENRTSLKKLKVIYLKVSIQTQLERTLNDSKRPLISNKSNKEEILRKLASDRAPFYEECSDLTINEKSNPDMAVDEILKNLDSLANG